MRTIKELRFGTPGIPASTQPRDTINGIKRVKALGLGAMELEFVQSINVSKEKAPLVRKTAEDNDVVLTCHGQFWVNLASLEAVKIAQSRQRMIDAATRMAEVGGYSITWHLAFYQGQAKEKVYEAVKKTTKEVVKTLKDAGHSIWLRPETTGKATQWGDIDECLKLSSEVEMVMPCVDFSHMHARTNGKENTYEEFRTTLSKVERTLGKEGLHNMHIQIAGIAYGEKGEKHHLNLKDSDLNYRLLLQAIKEFDCKGVIISESPNIEEDSLLLQETYRSL